MQAAKERLAVPKNLIACNTKLKSSAQLEAFVVHPSKLNSFSLLDLYCCCFPHDIYLGFTPVKRVAYDL